MRREKPNLFRKTEQNKPKPDNPSRKDRRRELMKAFMLSGAAFAGCTKKLEQKEEKTGELQNPKEVDKAGPAGTDIALLFGSLYALGLALTFAERAVKRMLDRMP